MLAPREGRRRELVSWLGTALLRFRSKDADGGGGGGVELVVSWNIAVGVGGEAESCVEADVRLPVNCTFFLLFFFSSFFLFLSFFSFHSFIPHTPFFFSFSPVEKKRTWLMMMNDAGTDADEMRSLAKVGDVFRNLVKERGVFEAAKCVVGLVFQ